MIKRCPRHTPTPAGHHNNHHHHHHQHQQHLQSRPAAKLLGPNQLRPAQGELTELALRARQSSSLSLFNRLDNLVHQLDATRNFFAEWPQRLCDRLRRVPARSVGSPGAPKQTTTTASSQQEVCWNGREYGRYNKELAEFGQISGSHPEVPISGQPFHSIVLNLVDRFKEIGQQMLRKSSGSPILSLFSSSLKLDSMRTTSAASSATTTSINTREQQTPSAEARVSNTNNNDNNEPALIAGAVAQLTGGSGAELLAAESASQLPQSSSQELSEPNNGGGANNDDPQDQTDDEERADQTAGQGDSANETSNEDNNDDTDDEDPSDNPECIRQDCSDLLERTNSNSNSNNPNANNNHGLDEQPTGEQQAVERPAGDPMMGPSVVVMAGDNLGRPYTPMDGQQDTNDIYQPTGNHLEGAPSSPNDLYAAGPSSTATSATSDNLPLLHAVILFHLMISFGVVLVLVTRKLDLYCCYSR